MSIFEYDEEKELKLLREAEYQAGVEDGIEIGEKNGIEIGRKDGIEIGRKDGIEIGRLASLKIMKKTLNDFETVYYQIKEEEIFSDLTKEEIKALFDYI